MRKLLVAFLALFSISVSSYGCALCALRTPTAHVLLTFDQKSDVIKNVHVYWQFSQKFTSQLYYGYDLNDNKKFEKDELAEIEKTLLDYLFPRAYLMYLSYYDTQDKNPTKIKIHPKNLDFYMKGDRIFFEFDQPVSIEMKKDRIIKARFLDKEGFFNFKMINKSSFKIGHFAINPNPYFNSAFFEIDTKIKETKPSKSVENSKKLNPYYAFLSKKLNIYTQKIKELFSQSRDNPYALLTLMFFSFLYGLFHAAGPGHGKMLVGSYFMSNGGDYLKAFWLCLKIGFIHVIGAFMLVFVSVYFIKIFMSQLISNVAFYTTILSSVIILALGFYLIYKKISNQNSCSCSCCSHEHSHNHAHHHEHNHSHEHSHHHGSSKHEWSLALAAGLVPCPGTVAIFILAFTFGNYISGILSAVSLAFGMSVVIFVASVFGNLLHIKSSSSYERFRGVVEYIGLGVLIVLGTIMFISAFSL